MTIHLPYGMEAPADIVERLKQIDPLLSLRFVEFPTGADGDAIRWWALTLDWPKEDQRYLRVQRGELGNQPYDVLGYLPLDCSLADAYNYVVTHLRGQQSRPDVDRMLQRVGEYNRTQTKAAMTEVQERADEVIDMNKKTIFAEQGKTVPRVFQSGGKRG